MSIGATLRKWTFREPVLMWTFYITVGAFTIPFATKWAIEASSTRPVRHPPTTKEMIEAIHAQNAAKAAQGSS